MPISEAELHQWEIDTQADAGEIRRRIPLFLTEIECERTLALLAEVRRLRGVIADLEDGLWVDAQVEEILTAWHGPLHPSGKEFPEERTLVEAVMSRVVARLREGGEKGNGDA